MNKIEIEIPHVSDDYFEKKNVSFTFTNQDKPLGDLFTNTHDVLYYDRLRAELNHLFYRYEIGLLGNRQIILVSDECISMIHILPSPELTIVNVYQRSCNYKTSFKEDIGFIIDYFMQQHQNVEINYKIGSLHYYKK